MIQIIPAIDIIEGHCVRLSQGDYARQKTYDASPVDMVKRYVDCGMKRIHVVDLDGAKTSQPKNLRILEQMAGIRGVEIEWGGGLKSDTALRDLFNAGATYAIVGSLAAKNPECFSAWLSIYGPEHIILGADVREGKVSVSGWQEDLDMSIEDLIGRFLQCGLSQVICTDISRDGMLEGPSFNLYTSLQGRFPDVDFTVSGGISSIADIIRLEELGLRKVIIGKAIYENRITLKELEKYVS